VTCAVSFVTVMLNVVYCSMQMPGVLAAVGIYADDEITMSSFCPTITDVRSVTWEPEGDTIISLSSIVGERQPGTSGSKSASSQLEKPTAAGLQYDAVSSHPSNSSECVASGCSASLVNRSLVSFRPLASFADSSASDPIAAEPDLSRSILSTDVMLECSSHENSCSSVEDLILLPDCERLSATESSGVGSRNCADNRLTADCRGTRAEDVGGCKLISLDRFSKTAAAASDVVSIRPVTAYDETLVPCTNSGDGKKCSYSEAVSIDGSVKGKLVQSTERRRSDTESWHDAVTFQHENETSSSSLTWNKESKKRKFKTTAKTGIFYFLLCTRYKHQNNNDVDDDDVKLDALC